MDKLQKVRNVIAHAGSEYSFDGEFVRLRGTIVVYFRIRNGGAEAGSVGFCDISPGIGAMSLNKVLEALEHIAYSH